MSRGGARPGAGRPRKIQVQGDDLPPGERLTAMQVLESAMNNPALDWRLRFDAAKALLPYQEKKAGAAGKKEDRQDAAKQAATGRFGSRPAPGNVIPIDTARKP